MVIHLSYLKSTYEKHDYIFYFYIFYFIVVYISTFTLWHNTIRNRHVMTYRLIVIFYLQFIYIIDGPYYTLTK